MCVHVCVRECCSRQALSVAPPAPPGPCSLAGPTGVSWKAGRLSAGGGVGSHPASGRKPSLARESGEKEPAGIAPVSGCGGPAESRNGGSELKNPGLPAPSVPSIRVS